MVWQVLGATNATVWGALKVVSDDSVCPTPLPAFKFFALVILNAYLCGLAKNTSNFLLGHIGCNSFESAQINSSFKKLTVQL